MQSSDWINVVTAGQEINESLGMSSIEEGAEGSDGIVKQKRRKSFKNIRRNRGFQWKFLFGCLIVESYFVYNFTNSRYSLENLQQLMLEMNSTSISKGWYARTFNMLRWMILDDTIPMGGQKSEDIISAQVRGLYDHDVYVHW